MNIDPYEIMYAWRNLQIIDLKKKPGSLYIL